MFDLSIQDVIIIQNKILTYGITKTRLWIDNSLAQVQC